MEASVRTRGALDIALILGFLVVLVTPGVAYLTSHDEAARQQEIRERELRPNLEPPPELSLAELESWPTTIDAWWPQRIGLRTDLLRLRGRLWWQVFGEVPGDRMVRGRDGWMFLARGAFLDLEDDFLDAWRGARPLTEGQVAQWVDVFAERRDWLAERGIAHLVVIAPQKAEVYPDRAPARYPRVGPSQADQVLPKLIASGVDVLDLRALFDEARTNDRDGGADHLYHPSGTHWSKRGDALAYDAIARRLQANQVLSERPWSTYEEQPFLDDGDSWERRAYLDGLVPRMREEWILVGAPQVRPRRVPGTRRAQYVRRDGAGPHLVLVHDSYGLQVRDLLALHGDVTAFRSYAFDTGRIAAAHPAVVVELYVDRMFSQHDPRVLHLRPDLDDVVGSEVWTSSDIQSVELGQQPAQRSGRLTLAGFPESGDEAWILELDLSAPGPGGVSAIAFASSLKQNPPWEGPAEAVQAGRQTLRMQLPVAALQARKLDLLFEGSDGTWTLHRATLVRP
tara:strand:- start:6837 stop:8369 length:1533 start_codon:yes stop_codon:yes gene_type:complete